MKFLACIALASAVNGAAAFVALCDRLTEKYGARFAPPQLLREMAAKGESFYGRYSAHQHAA